MQPVSSSIGIISLPPSINFSNVYQSEQYVGQRKSTALSKEKFLHKHSRLRDSTFMIQKSVTMMPLLRAASCKFSAHVWKCYFTVYPDTPSHQHNKQFFKGCVFSKRHSTLGPWTSLEGLSYACIGFKNNSVQYEIELHTCIFLSDVIFLKYINYNQCYYFTMSHF